ncbi:MAG: hypothetical protein COX62_06045 [Deltaproteobacteria bacterium CG_4_10_14_0_2_um_filter_43_8]|nr:MAG: hypothetical protein COV43_07235 [Deltaproteobacteria bacterium CG11_big_fil_rev_8_21_14_0_20_42_23]PJA19762.1 MAG: hypothetical protein COX62_06045 [Deltaproteobacteria bacterium CG_4_10_14_0_2_um_filter_43_8]PJC64189.1 MAG: hypothetical protein CO021_05600 [Deltaproteobacteria bacterium CG_4_9_14_0_2_um_filter_42_21]
MATLPIQLRLPFSGQITGSSAAPHTALATPQTPTIQKKIGHWLVPTGNDEFLLPNELHPLQARPILSQAPHGAIVSVGSERLLFHALQMPSVTHILGVDYSPSIVRFHRINNALLRTYDSCDNYMQARTCDNYEVWRNHFTSGNLTHDEYLAVSDKETFKWWSQVIGPNKAWNYVYEKAEEANSPFYGVQYMGDAKLFSQVASLAQRGAYTAMCIDLGEAAALEQLATNVQQNFEPISVFDLSNAWQDEFPNSYLGVLKTATLLESIIPLMHVHGLILFTMGTRLSFNITRMVYVGFRVQALHQMLGKSDTWTGKKYTMQHVVIRMADIIKRQLTLANQNKLCCMDGIVVDEM